MEPVIWAYAYGRPKESIEVQVGPLDALESLSEQELIARLKYLIGIDAAAPGDIIDIDSRHAEQDVDPSASRPVTVQDLEAEGNAAREARECQEEEILRQARLRGLLHTQGAEDDQSTSALT
jgi:hypothetical protein